MNVTADYDLTLAVKGEAMQLLLSAICKQRFISQPLLFFERKSGNLFTVQFKCKCIYFLKISHLWPLDIFEWLIHDVSIMIYFDDAVEFGVDDGGHSALLPQI